MIIYLQNIAAWWQAVPFGTKGIMIMGLLFWIMSLMFGQDFYDLWIVKPRSLQIWTIFTSQLVQGLKIMFTVGGFIGLLVNSLACFDSVKVEKRLGTVLFIYEMFIKCAIAELMYVLILFIASLLNYDLGASYGFWNPIIYFGLFRSLQYPDEDHQVMSQPLTIKSKFYWALLVIILNIMMFPRVDILCYALLATFEVRIFKGSLLRIKKTMIESIENSMIFNPYQSRQDFIVADHAIDLTQQIDFNVFQQNQQVEQLPLPNLETPTKEESAIEVNDSTTPTKSKSNYDQLVE